MRHGVTRYAELLIAAGQVPDDRVTRVPRTIGPADVDELLALLPATRCHIHIHVTDHLIGRAPEEAATVVTALAARHRISLTLHDLPQPSDGRVQPRRAAAYAAMSRAAVATVVSSHHEHALLTAALLTTAPSGTPEPAPAVTVIPLAVPAPRSCVAQPAQEPHDIAVLGWVYPGKGHTEVLGALRNLPGEVGLAVLGGASPGHEHLLDELRGRAAQLGRRLRVTGWIPDAEVTTQLRSAAVPVLAHRHVSASGSLASWLGAGRCPVVTRSPYTEELAHRLPGAMTLVEDHPRSLSRALAAALHDPASTWLGPEVPLGPSAAEAATALHSWLTR